MELKKQSKIFEVLCDLVFRYGISIRMGMIELSLDDNIKLSLLKNKSLESLDIIDGKHDYNHIGMRYIKRNKFAIFIPLDRLVEIHKKCLMICNSVTE